MLICEGSDLWHQENGCYVLHLNFPEVSLFQSVDLICKLHRPFFFKESLASIKGRQA